MRERAYAVCECCGRKVEYTQCSERGAPPEDARCRVLSGWLSVSCWKGTEAVDYYDFCSLVCLQRWVNTQILRIPQIFLKAFEDD